MTHKLVLGFLAVTLVMTALGAVFAYRVYLAQAEQEKVADLSLYVRERSRSERELFQNFHDQADLAVAALGRRLADPSPDAAARFDAWFPDHRDGTRRSSLALLDGTRLAEGGRIWGVAGFIGHAAELTAQDKALLLSAAQVTAQFGEARGGVDNNFWFIAPKTRFTTFAPKNRARLEFYRSGMPAVSSWDALPVGKLPLPENDPERAMRCTQPETLHRDLEGDWPLVAHCVVPAYIGGRYVGAFGSTLFLASYLDQVVKRAPQGAHTLIVTDDGSPIRGVKAASPLAGAAALKPLVARIKAERAPQGVVETPDGKTLVAYGFLPEPHWLLLVSFSKADIEQAALAAVLPVVAFTILSVGVQLALLLWITRGLLLRPLTQLSRHKREDAVSQELAAIEARDDEVGGLARSLSEERRLNRDILAGLEQRVRERTAELERANLAKSAFLANMSHELRTPLNGVVALSKLLQQEQTTARGRKSADLVVASGRLLEQVLSDILDFSKIEAGQLRLNEAPFDLRACVDNIAALHGASAADKGLDFRCEVDAALGDWRRGDDVRVTQILSNLLSNAVKFTETGTVTLRVEPAGDQAVFTVEDTGVGFSEEFRARLFRRFEQADASTTRRFGGTGLGLAICAYLVELMGGAIEAVSEPGRGSTFTVTLPLPPAHAPEEAQAGEAEAPRGDLARLSVLVAEDHPTNRKVVELVLEPLGVQLTMVDNGRKAVEALTAGRFDLVLMDVQMPVLDGLAATREIRAREAELDLPRSRIYALTANALPEHIEQTRAAGMDGHVSKPIRPEALIAILTAAASTNEGAAAA